MSLIRRLILSLALSAGIFPAFAQVPPPVPALPDTERRTSYSLTASTCSCSVGFALYGDSTDYANWLEVFVNGALVPASGNWTITSPTGSLGFIARPITDAVLTFTAAQTGTVQIVGARRPRRTSQFNEGAGVSARNVNQVVTDIIATQRELWDKTNDFTGRGVFAPPGETLALLPIKANRLSQGACFDSNGNLVNCVSIPSSTFIAGTAITLTGANPTAINVNPAALGALGVDTNTLNAQAANYPIVAGDAGKTIYVTGGPFTVTLPAVTGFASNAVVSVCNGNPNNNSSHAVLLSGFPNPIFRRLYMQQCVSVAIENGLWAARVIPGRFHPAFTPTLLVDNGGSSTNDGFVSNAAANALDSMATCYFILQVEYDLAGNIQPICSPTGGQTFVGSWSIIGPLVGASVINITGNGGVAILQPTTTPAAGFVLQLSDFAPYMISTNITWDCTGGTAGCVGISFHQQSGADLNAGTTLKGNAVGHNGVSCDSKCKINVGASPLIIAGTMNYGATLDEGSIINFNSGVTFAASANLPGGLVNAAHNSNVAFAGALIAGAGLTIGEIFTLRSNSTGCLNANFTTSGSFGTARQWSVLNNAFFGNASGNAVPGSVPGINTLATFAGGVVANSGLSSGGC
ncbi:MAG TPA: hypothetical protein VIM11_26690 [Tepidisphaeraceae bacterium]|jgi:hypothetical protein